MSAVSPRRIALAVGAFVLLSLLLYNGRDAVDSQVSWPSFGAHRGKAGGGRLRPEDHWEVPELWDPLLSIYDNFTDIDNQYTSSIRLLQAQHGPEQRPTNPYLAYAEKSAGGAYAGSYVPCIGPRGTRLGLEAGGADDVLEYIGRPAGFAEAPIGSTAEVGFEQDVCFERRGRHTAYGDNFTGNNELRVNWDEVNWGQLQRACTEDNKVRFDLTPRAGLRNAPAHFLNEVHKTSANSSKHVPRTAIVFRSHQLAIFTPEIRRNMRAIITELALRTGGEYEAFLLLEVKEKDISLWDDPAVYQKKIDEVVPPEFRDITVLWDEWRWRNEYPLLPESTLLVHKSQWLPLQYFQKLHPEFDFYWNWEMDVRYTGHYFELMRALDTWTTAQPRRGMWERSARFYIPRLHGTYEQYRAMVQARYNVDGKDTSVWGPRFPGGQPSAEQAQWLSKLNVTPPAATPSGERPAFSWGVGEQADFLTFLPMFDPDTTNYVYADAYFNYPPALDSDVMPRRTTVITFSRLSARLLRLMELENTTPPGHHMSSESWPQSVALHYGLKAVTVPHGVYMEKDWPAQAADRIFNNGDQKPVLDGFEGLDRRGEGAGGPESTFGLGREHNWGGSTWYYQDRLAERLYKRWMGYEIDGIGGREWEETNGRYCLPPMLLHPVKLIDDPLDNL